MENKKSSIISIDKHCSWGIAGKRGFIQWAELKGNLKRISISTYITICHLNLHLTSLNSTTPHYLDRLIIGVLLIYYEKKYPYVLVIGNENKIVCYNYGRTSPWYDNELCINLTRVMCNGWGKSIRYTEGVSMSIIHLFLIQKQWYRCRDWWPCVCSIANLTTKLLSAMKRSGEEPCLERIDQ